ncbi:hypothetical protein Moror_4413 [Moniliophthora roreri MCA 2997]|uniref:Uncharacterized protein n=2 Tax=Moniliophthora roreri TaxID=221103 RepID=V2XFN5_MONRO|nr:hypothetical protein Moror_4413 [Moniliophthora roreri MCA 2997]KAI3607772.1 hypothetical protein WG66_004660 [Moniliophthora roreri]
MPSFSTIFTIASLACSAFAAPLADLAVGAKAAVAVPPVAKADAAAGLGLEVRHDQEKTVPVILTDVTVEITAVIAPLTFITQQNATVEVIVPILEDVKGILSGAIADIKVVVGGAGGLVGGLLTLVGKVLSVVDLACLIAALLKVVFTALGAVLKVVAAADKDVIKPLLIEVAKLVAELLKIILPLVGGLLAALLPLVADVLVVVDVLGVASVFAAIGLKL